MRALFHSMKGATFDIAFNNHSFLPPELAMPLFQEARIEYPAAWETEYCETGTVAQWFSKFPDLFYSGSGSPTGISGRLGTLDLFAQHALMYLLRQQLGMKSVTWLCLADTTKNSKNRDRTMAAWAQMREQMGAATFESLQSNLLSSGFTSFKGEPDLFCWHPENGTWFFAEAKRKDKLLATQLQWFEICQQLLQAPEKIVVYSLSKA